MAKGTVNKVTLIGRLGQDPEIRFTGEGNAVASFSVATNESWKSKDGNIQERTEWTKVTVFGATAEKYVQPYAKKGTLVYVEGSLKTDKCKTKTETINILPVWWQTTMVEFKFWEEESQARIRLHQ